MTPPLTLVVVVFLLDYAAGLQCYDCHNITDLNSCSKTVSCASTQSCYMEATQPTSTQWAYTVTCKDNNHCGPLNSSRSNTGRSAGNLSKLLTRRNANPCHECCSTDYCNNALCNHKPPSSCADDQSIDCAKNEFDIQYMWRCTQGQTVDGNWNNWSTWSGCDVTCGNGTRTRYRTCSNPAPENGGLDCVGEALANNACILDRCPVHGGWSQWAPWGSCSVTCDVGMQRRDRSCSNPYPALGGDHCFGDSRDDKICYMPGCTNGKWSPWQPWTSCSATCFGGHRTRYRVCSNPYPSLLGHYCDGLNQEMDHCNLISCGDGAWSTWKTWGACSKTCGGGTHSRNRTCDNPRPSLFGKACDGSSEVNEPCNTVPCVENGSWSTWKSWGACSRPCGGGTRTRNRTCDNPPPSLFGKTCDGLSENNEPCNTAECLDIVDPCSVGHHQGLLCEMIEYQGKDWTDWMDWTHLTFDRPHEVAVVGRQKKRTVT